jgi:hypothetical protein
MRLFATFGERSPNASFSDDSGNLVHQAESVGGRESRLSEGIT